MKKCIVAIGFMVSAASFADPQVEALCGYVKDDNRNQIRRLLSDNRINLRNIYAGIRCDNESLLQLAIRNDAFDSGTFIIKQMPSKELRDFDYESWATENSLSHSPLINVIKTRIGE